MAARRSLRITSLLVLATLLAALLDVPFSLPARDQPAGADFPCASHSCSCTSADACAANCCCAPRDATAPPHADEIAGLVFRPGGCNVPPAETALARALGPCVAGTAPTTSGTSAAVSFTRPQCPPVFSRTPAPPDPVPIPHDLELS